MTIVYVGNYLVITLELHDFTCTVNAALQVNFERKLNVNVGSFPNIFYEVNCLTYVNGVCQGRPQA